MPAGELVLLNTMPLASLPISRPQAKAALRMPRGPHGIDPAAWRGPVPAATVQAEALDACATVHCEAAAVFSARKRDPTRCLHDHELHLIGAMPARLRLGSGADEDTHSFAPGTVVLLGPRLPRSLAFEHRVPLIGTTDGLVLRFSDEPLRRGMALFPELGDVGPLLARARQGVQFVGLGAETRARLRRIETLNGLARFAEFTALLNELAQWTDYRLLAGAVLADEGSRDEDGRVLRMHKALDHIRDNYADELSLAEVGAIVGMREDAFSRCFRRTTGQTFTDFVIGLRVAKACRLLALTRQQVSGICYEVGFNNISNFNRHFRRIKGMTPGEFRAGHLRATS